MSTEIGHGSTIADAIMTGDGVRVDDETLKLSEKQDEEKQRKEKEMELSSGQFFKEPDSKKVFQPKKLSDHLLIHNHIKFMGKTLWIYDDEGFYKPSPFSDQYLKQQAQLWLGDDSRKNRIEDTLYFLKNEKFNDEPLPRLDTDYLNLNNGRLNWRTGELLHHSYKYFDIIRIPVDYDPKAVCPIFDYYLESTFKNDPEIIPLVEEIVGYCLIPEFRFEKAFMLTGSGANGKSVFLDVLISLLGSNNVSNIPLQEIEDHRFKRKNLMGKLANIFSDLDSRSLKSTGIFLSLVSGDIIDAEAKFSNDELKFANTARLIFSSNDIPRSYNHTYAYYRRWIIIPFNRTFKGKDRDDELRNKLKQPCELSGILNHAITGMKRLHQNKGFSIPEQSEKQIEQYKLLNDSVTAFIDECVIKDSNEIILKQEFYASYKLWCGQQNIKPKASNKIRSSLETNIPFLDEARLPDSYGKWHWIGMRLTNEAP